MSSEVTERADFSQIRYAQCWEDADILLDALGIKPGHTCLSIASAGDNALAMLTKAPAKVIALDLNLSQLACLELRVAAYKTLQHKELLELIGSRPGQQRQQLYQRCRSLLSGQTRQFWDRHSAEITQGIGAAGKFERYFAMFRNQIIPLIHNKNRIKQLLAGGSPDKRKTFYAKQWNNRRWRLMFKLFFSRFVMGRFGRDPEFFRYVEGSVAEHILKHTQYALTELDPADNPYLQWILTGTHTTALPYALREEHFDQIRNNIDRLEWYPLSIEEYLDKHKDVKIDCYNLSDIFEYMSETNYAKLLEQLINAGNPGGRLAYWNMLVPRKRPEAMANRLRPLTELADKLYARDKAFFYSAFIVEEII